MTEKRFTIVNEEFILYFSGTAHKISNGECTFRLWHNKEESQTVCDKLNEVHKENIKLKKENEQLKRFITSMGFTIEKENGTITRATKELYK